MRDAREKGGPGKPAFVPVSQLLLTLGKECFVLLLLFSFLCEHRSPCLPAESKYPSSVSSGGTQEASDWTACLHWE